MTRNAPLTDEAMRRFERLERARVAREAEYARPGGELEKQANRLTALAAWSHKNEGTPETHAHAARTRQGALSRLYMSGSINADQLAWAVEIAMVAEGIEADVSVRSSSMEMRVDYSGSGRSHANEAYERVRQQIAYDLWRQWIPQPKRAVLDMIIGEAVSYRTVAQNYRMRKERARAMLIDALDLWPDAKSNAEKVEDAVIAAAQAGLM